MPGEDYYRKLYGGHIWPKWYRAQAVKRGNQKLAVCCMECAATVEGWKLKQAEAK